MKHKVVGKLKTKQLNEITQEIRNNTENGKQKNGNYSIGNFIWNIWKLM